MDDGFYGIPGVTFDDARELLIYKGQPIDPDAFFDDLEATYLGKHPQDKELRDFEDWCWFNPDAVKKMLDSYTKSEEPTLDEIYHAVAREYNGKLFSDNFLKTNITLHGDQIICWFDFDKYDPDYEEKCDSAILFYDEVVGFLVDKFGEIFKYEDPRISDEYIDKNNMHGQFEIVLDEDDKGENSPVIAIWENEESKR